VNQYENATYQAKDFVVLSLAPMLDHINSLKTSMTLTRPYELLTMQVLSSTYCDIFTSFPPGTLHTQSLYFWALSNRLSKHFRHHDKQQWR
jgi:hypothetical protein